MKIRHADIEIPDANPFLNCKLNREQFAKILTSLVKNYGDGFVLAVNNEWGTGKTTFITMWKQHLKNAGYETLYFNAWENDFESNPLVALMSELKTLVKGKNPEGFTELLKKGAILTKSILPSVAKAIVRNYVDTEAVTDAIKNATDAVADILKEEIDEYAKKKEGLIAFRNTLQKFIRENNNNKPVVFIIDELDRCRPDYAVEVLENVKHFFNVPGIIFVLSIDKVQLCNAVKGFYGSEHINANEYLRRFIDVEYSLPVPSTKEICEYLYEYFQFDNFLRSPERINYSELFEDKDSLILFSSILFEHFNLSFRQQEKIFSHARIVMNIFRSNSYIFPSVFMLLIYIRFFDPAYFNMIKERRLKPQYLINSIRKFYPENILEDSRYLFQHTESLVLLLYYNYYREINYKEEMYSNPEITGKRELLIKSAFDSDKDNQRFARLVDENRNTRYGNTKLDYLLKKIDLAENFTI